mmetsp:Transcript_36467/g.87937  ORF Transcript_36467/g.87937 Transcript_36467/m.87937 type:complete len:115 (+) Transcript_36467:1617-1961(+)
MLVPIPALDHEERIFQWVDDIFAISCQYQQMIEAMGRGESGEWEDGEIDGWEKMGERERGEVELGGVRKNVGYANLFARSKKGQQLLDNEQSTKSMSNEFSSQAHHERMQCQSW